MTIKEFLKKAKEVKELYAELSIKSGQDKWTYREFTEALVSDAGDLMKLVMVKSGFRPRKTNNLDEDIKHEVVDCLWALLMISSELGIDLDKEYPKKISKLKLRVKSLLGNRASL